MSDETLLRPQGASPTPCTQDGDCPASLVCYGQSLSWTQNDSFCLCSTWYAWDLDEENEPNCLLTTNTIVTIVFFSVVGLFLLYRLGILLLVFKRFRSVDTIQKNFPFAVASVFCLGWIISTILRMALLSVEFASPEIQTFMPFGPGWKYSPIGYYQTRPLLVVTTMLRIVVDFQLIVVWFVVATDSSRASRGGMTLAASHRQHRPLKMIVTSFEIIFIVGGSILIALEEVSVFLYFCASFLILAVIGYAVAGPKLHVLLSDAIRKQPLLREESRERLKKVASAIRFTAIANAILILLSIGAAIALAEINKNFKEYGFIPAGILNFSLFLTASQIWVVTRYLSCAVTPQARSSKRTSATMRPLISKVKGLYHGNDRKDATSPALPEIINKCPGGQTAFCSEGAHRPVFPVDIASSSPSKVADDKNHQPSQSSNPPAPITTQPKLPQQQQETASLLLKQEQQPKLPEQQQQQPIHQLISKPNSCESSPGPKFDELVYV